MFVWSKLSSQQWLDAWQERFPQAVITQVFGKKTIRVEVYCERAKEANVIQEMWGGQVRELKQQNWAAMTPEPPAPLKVRQSMVVCSARTEAEMAKARRQFPGREIISIPPDMAFGTGHHATTATMLRFLDDAARKLRKQGQPWTVADLGCGSGILAIAAVKLGAKSVWGCDFDPLAVKVAKENITRNGVEKEARFVCKDILEWTPPKQWDVVIANIFVDVLEAAFPQIIAAVKPGGVIMVSGILYTHAEGCLAVAEKLGVKWQQVVRKGKWVSACGVAPGA